MLAFDYSWKLENLDKTDTCTGSKCTFHTERALLIFKPVTFLLLGDSADQNTHCYSNIQEYLTVPTGLIKIERFLVKRT